MQSSDLQAHVEALAKEHGVAVDYKRFARPVAHLASASVVVRPIRSLVTYYAALHELGHVVTDDGRTVDWATKVLSRHIEHGEPIPDPPPILEREHDAWQWALDHGIEPPTPAVWALIHHGLVSHMSAELVRQALGGRERVPRHDHPFHVLMHHAAANM